MYKVPGATGTVGGAGALVMTGADVVWWVAFGVVLVIGGLLMLRATRQKRSARGER